jgi:hypothetical protein
MQKRISELTPEQQEQQRARWREAQSKSRAGKKVAETPTYDEWSWEFHIRFPEQFDNLNSYTKDFVKTVAEELAREPNELPVEQIAQVAWVLRSFEKRLIQTVLDPNGEIFGGLLYADSIGKYVVAAAAKFNLTKSLTFLTAFKELLRLLNDRYGTNTDQHAQAVKQALSEI